MQSQIIDIINAFSQENIPIWKPVFIEIPRYIKSYGVQGDVVLVLMRILYGKAEAARLWYEKLRNILLYRGFVMRKVDPCLFMSKTVICVVYVDDFIFCARS